MSDERHDHSRVDAFMAARRRAMVLHAVWRPMLAGGAGAAIVIAAVALAQPRFAYRDIEIPKARYVETEIPRLTPRDYELPHITTREILIPIPKIVEPSPLARTPDERRFSSGEDWTKADVRGRILRANKNGFDLATEDGTEQSFYPAKIGANGKVEPNEGMRDVVEPFLDDLAACRPMPDLTYVCIAEHEGREVPIRQIPIKLGRPT